MSVDPDGGASWKGKMGNKLAPCSREIKMLRPICRDCEEAVGGAKHLDVDWAEKCPHGSPYVSMAVRRTTKPTYEDVLDDKGKPTGAKRITGQEIIEEYYPRPNWVSVADAGGLNKGKGVSRALKKGFIFPQQLRAPEFPEGIKRRCQYRECYREDLHKYKTGWFCREVEARLVKVSDSETVYEVGQFSRRSDQIQKETLERMAI